MENEIKNLTSAENDLLSAAEISEIEGSIRELSEEELSVSGGGSYYRGGDDDDDDDYGKKPYRKKPYRKGYGKKGYGGDDDYGD